MTPLKIETTSSGNSGHWLITVEPYDGGLIEDLKTSLSERRYKPSSCAWVAPFHWRNAEGLRGLYERRELPDLPASVMQLIDQHDHDLTHGLPFSEPQNYKFCKPDRPMFLHQQMGFRNCITPKFFANGHFLQPDMGAGKTRIVLEVFNYFSSIDESTRLLIVCPLSPMGVWGSELDNWLDDFSTFKDINYLVGTSAKRIELLRQDRKINVINYDGVKTIQDELVLYLKKNPRTILVADESTAIKNPAAQRSRALLELSQHAWRRYALSGTPITQSYVDLYSQLNFIDPRIIAISNEYQFKNRYCIYGGYQGYELLGYKNLDELERITKPYCYRILKSECLDLPDKIFSTITCDMGKQQKQCYENLKNEHATEIDGNVVTGALALTRMLRYQQITSGYLPVNNEDGNDHQTIKEMTNPKLDLLKEFIRETVIETGHKLAIVVRFHYDLNKIAELIRSLKLKHIEISGRVPIKNRLGLDKLFDNSPDIQIALLQETAAKEGLTMISCSHVVFYSLTFSLNDYMQIQDRFHRPGQKSNVNYYAMVCKDTIDQGLFRILKRKFDPADYLIKYGESGLKTIINGGMDL